MTAGGGQHPARARLFLADAERARFHDGALWEIRRRRDRRARSLPEWEELRLELARTEKLDRHFVIPLWSSDGRTLGTANLRVSLQAGRYLSTIAP